MHYPESPKVTTGQLPAKIKSINRMFPLTECPVFGSPLHSTCYPISKLSNVLTLNIQAQHLRKINNHSQKFAIQTSQFNCFSYLLSCDKTNRIIVYILFFLQSQVRDWECHQIYI